MLSRGENCIPVLIVSLLLAIPGLASAQEVEGFVEVRGQFDLGVDGDAWQAVERVRPAFGVDLSERLSLSATVEAGLHQGRTLQREVQRAFEGDPTLGPALEAAGCVWPEADNDILSVNGVDDYLRVERLYLDVYSEAVDLRFGRQAIQWGSGMIVNPTDPFPQVLQTQPWLPRAGVNSVRSTIPIGELHQVQVVVGSNDAFTAVRAAARGTVAVGATDISLVGAFRDDADDGIAGVDIKGTLGVGFWLESAVHIREDELFEEVAVGLDYSFPVLDALLVAVQYYRNGGGSPDASNAVAGGGLTSVVEPPTCTLPVPLPTDGAEADPFAPFFRGRDYAMVTANLAISPDYSVTTLWIQNLNDGTAFAVPVVSAYLFDRFEVSLAGQIPLAVWGDGGELKPSAEDLLIGLGPNGGPPNLDVSGLLPDASIIAWTRVSF